MEEHKNIETTTEHAVWLARTGKLDPESQAIFKRLMAWPAFVVEPHQKRLTKGQLERLQREGRAPEPLPPDRLRLVFERQGVRLELGEQSWRSHPGMGLVRLRRVLKGEPDPLLDAAQITAGERVLDATFGYGHDSLLLAHAVGEGGKVFGLEANPALAALAQAGLRFWTPPAHEIMRRVEVLQVEHREFLRELPDKSVDLVYFDPMFRTGISAAPGFELLRMLGHPAKLDAETLIQAKRVAKRAVLMKDAAPGRELERLDLSIVGGRRHAKVLFGVWRREEGEL